MDNSNANPSEVIKSQSSEVVEQTIDVIREYAGQGMTRQEIADRLKKSYGYVRLIVKCNNIKVERASRGVTRRPEIDELLTGGYTLEQIGMRRDVDKHGKK